MNKNVSDELKKFEEHCGNISNLLNDYKKRGYVYLFGNLEGEIKILINLLNSLVDLNYDLIDWNKVKILIGTLNYFIKSLRDHYKEIEELLDEFSRLFVKQNNIKKEVKNEVKE